MADGNPSEPRTLDAAIDVRGNQGVTTTLAVEAKNSFEPRDVDNLLPGLARQLRSLGGNIPVLVVAPWLSERTRERLAAEGINSIDLTGNGLVRLENPTLYLESVGARRNPNSTPSGRARVRGPKAARVVRLLADVRPPYGVRQLARATGLTPGYVSRLLDSLDREALIERSGRGQVASVDLAGLLRRWAESYDVFTANRSLSFLAPNGASTALSGLEHGPERAQVAITGSFAAVRLAPVAAPALLVAYCRDEQSNVAAALDLLPADEGANVVLLQPFDRVVWDLPRREGSLLFVAPSQVVVDCLTGTGRMPSEGEAVLAWMLENEQGWRLGSIEELKRMPTWGSP